jgi:hypothetical protein
MSEVTCPEPGSQLTVGSITFGPHRLNSADRGPDWPERHEGHSALKVVDGEIVTYDPHPAATLLLELIDADGVCLGLYWAGRSNRIEKGPRGIEVTYSLAKARRIPISMRDVAEQLAEALNEYTSIPSLMLGRTWRAVEYAG